MSNEQCRLISLEDYHDWKESQQKIHILNESCMKLENQLGDCANKIEELNEKLNFCIETIKKAIKYEDDYEILEECLKKLGENNE